MVSIYFECHCLIIFRSERTEQSELNDFTVPKGQLFIPEKWPIVRNRFVIQLIHNNAHLRGKNIVPHTPIHGDLSEPKIKAARQMFAYGTRNTTRIQ